MNIILCMTSTGTVSGFGFPSIELATQIFNEDYNHQDAFRYLLTHSKSNPRNLSPLMVSKIIQATGKTGVYIDSTYDIDQFILQNLRKVWVNYKKKEVNTSMYIKNTIACYPTFLERSVGSPIVLLTQEENMELLKDSDECANFGDSFTAYFKNSIVKKNFIFKKIQQVCYNKVHSIEASQAAAM